MFTIFVSILTGQATGKFCDTIRFLFCPFVVGRQSCNFFSVSLIEFFSFPPFDYTFEVAIDTSTQSDHAGQTTYNHSVGSFDNDKDEWDKNQSPNKKNSR